MSEQLGPAPANLVNPNALRGRVAIVTGGAQGIGWHIAATLAEAGATVVIADINEGLGEAAAQRLQERGATAIAHRLDVRVPDQVRSTVDRVFGRFSRLDILVNNAGIVSNSPSETMPDGEWLDVMDVNLNGTFWMSREAGRRMLAARTGTIVNVASMSGLVANRPQPQAHYNASKAAVIMLTRSLAAEWADRGVRVNSVSPGYIATELTQRGMANPVWASVWTTMTPMGRIGTPADVANAVLYLASDASSFATGSNLVLDGGYTAW